MSSLSENLVVIASSDIVFIEAKNFALLSDLERQTHVHVEACVLVADSREREMLLRRLPREIDHAFGTDVASGALRRMRQVPSRAPSLARTLTPGVVLPRVPMPALAAHALVAWQVALPAVHSFNSIAFYENHVVNATLWRTWLDTHASCDAFFADAASASLAHLSALCDTFSDAMTSIRDDYAQNGMSNFRFAEMLAVEEDAFASAYDEELNELLICCMRLVLARMPRVLSQLHHDIVCAGEAEALLFRYIRGVSVSTCDAQRWL